MEMIASSLTFCGDGGGVSPSGVQLPWTDAGAARGWFSSLTARLLGTLERGIQRMPGEGCAFHTAREFMNTGERLQALHLLGDGAAAFRAGAGHGQGAEFAAHLLRLG